MQIVFLSARPAMLTGTLVHVRAHLPWVDGVLVVTPQRLRTQVEALGVQVVSDEQLLGGAGPADHSARNYALRAALAVCDEVEPVFLASDDDCRPLLPLPETRFVRDGLHRRYRFGSLDDWELHATSMDACLLATRQLLALHGLPRQAYASHQPQVVDKALWAEVVTMFAPAAGRHALDEWSIYLNAAGALHPERFADPEPYLTLGWPEDTATWQSLLDPGALLFENCFLEHYTAGQVFEGIDPDDTSYASAVDKVVRWRTYELQVQTGERPAALAPSVEMGTIGAALRRARRVAVGDPVLRERQTQAARAAALRAQERPGRA